MWSPCWPYFTQCWTPPRSTKFHASKPGGHNENINSSFRRFSRKEKGRNRRQILLMHSSHNVSLSFYDLFLCLKGKTIAPWKSRNSGWRDRVFLGKKTLHRVLFRYHYYHNGEGFSTPSGMVSIQSQTKKKLEFFLTFEIDQSLFYQNLEVVD